ncbi:MAG: cytidylate kinase family protein [Eubacteriales bacterium]|nr:cytidylate kinase family protein [Eubacteriales bacterium]
MKTPAAKDGHVESVAEKDARTDYIITIGRSYGAGGRSIGKKVAGQLHIPYYDSELLERAARDSGLSHKFLQSIDEKPVDSSMLYRSVGFGTNDYKSIADQARWIKSALHIITSVPKPVGEMRKDMIFVSIRIGLAWKAL